MCTLAPEGLADDVKGGSGNGAVCSQMEWCCPQTARQPTSQIRASSGRRHAPHPIPSMPMMLSGLSALLLSLRVHVGALIGMSCDAKDQTATLLLLGLWNQHWLPCSSFC